MGKAHARDAGDGAASARSGRDAALESLLALISAKEVQRTRKVLSPLPSRIRHAQKPHRLYTREGPGSVALLGIVQGVKRASRADHDRIGVLQTPKYESTFNALFLEVDTDRCQFL